MTPSRRRRILRVMVAQLLAEARAAHSRYRASAGRIGQDGKVSHAPDLRASGAAVREALRRRVEAHALDPEHTDLAWHDDADLMRVSHEALLAFYAAYLARAPLL